MTQSDVVSAIASILRRSDTSGSTVQGAVEAFSYISSSSKSGSQAIVKENLLPLLVGFQRFHDPRILRSIYKTLHNIILHKDLVPAVVRQIPGSHLVSVLSRPINEETAEAALSILLQINQTDRLAFVGELKSTMAALLPLLDAPNADVRRRACSALAILGRYHRFNAHLLRSDIGIALIALSHPEIVDSTMVLEVFTRPNLRGTACEKIRKKFVPLLVNLLCSTDTRILCGACSALGQLTIYCDISPTAEQITYDIWLALASQLYVSK
ncbi:armadillo-type protein [Mycena capillaripes]|nr:armadillo-type protein [Mycena capillaripes]